MHKLLQEVNAIVDNIAFPDKVLRAVTIHVIDVKSDVGNWRRGVPKEVRCRYVLMLCAAPLMYSDVMDGQSSSIEYFRIWYYADKEYHVFRSSQSYETYAYEMESVVIIRRKNEKCRVVEDQFDRDAWSDISEWNAPKWVLDLPPYEGIQPLDSRRVIDHELRDRMYRLMRWKLSVLNDVQQENTADDSVMALEQSAFRDVTGIRDYDEDHYINSLSIEVAILIVESSDKKLRRLHAGRPFKALAKEKVWSMMPNSTKIRVIQQDAYNDLARFLAMDSVSDGSNSCPITAKR